MRKKTKNRFKSGASQPGTAQVVAGWLFCFFGAMCLISLFERDSCSLIMSHVIIQLPVPVFSRYSWSLIGLATRKGSESNSMVTYNREKKTRSLSSVIPVCTQQQTTQIWGSSRARREPLSYLSRQLWTGDSTGGRCCVMLRVAADQNGKDREKKRINGTIKKKN